ncbi:MAG: 50S ribosomal protein L10 [Actinomycetota bacterium]|nr:50S ribosomal protein L10 [Actinomycetota bacterium]
MARPEKEAIVSEIREKLKSAKSVVLTDYRGINFEQMTELRQKLRAQGVEYKVFKNTLAKIAARELGLTDLEPYLTGPTAMALSYEDPVASAKILIDFAKTLKTLELKGGLVEGMVVGADKIKDLANIPPRDVLLGMIAGGLKSPLYGLATSLSGIIRGLAVALSQVAEKKSA